jgi:hypothetical protein
MVIHARNEYGSDVIKYKLFRDRLFDEFKGLVFRNSGNDWSNTMFRDGLMTSMTVGLNFDQMAYRPSIFFLNGVYWGILNIREKINEHFIASNHGVNADDVIILENGGDVVFGSNVEWWSMYNFVSKNLMSYPNNYRYVASKIDVNSFIDYFATQIYYANHDWPGNNIRYWKTTDPKSKWRWIMYDTDFGFAGINGSYTSNSLEAATTDKGSGWPNPPWSTLLLRKLLVNDEFRDQFVNRFADLMNSTFLPDRVNKAIDEKSGAIQNEIGNHLKLWSTGNKTSWLSRVQVLRNFAIKRPSNMFTHIQQKFGYQDPVQLAVETDYFAGSVQLNSLNLTEFPWQGTYFPDVPVKLTAKPNPGYRFVKWEGVTTNSNLQTISINPKAGMKVTAIFEGDGSHLESIVINEISFNNSALPDPGDWVEIYNKGTQDIDLSGWKLTDSDTTHVYIFPSNSWIKANDFLVVSNNISGMKVVFGDVNNLIGTFDFGLGNTTDAVRLYSKTMMLIDEVSYSNVTPWKSFDLSGLWSFELKSPLINNNSGENWDYSIEYGTPGMRNTPYSPNPTVELSLSTNNSGISKNYPNPFTDGTYIEFQLDKPGTYKLSVMDITGRVIRNLSDDDQFSRIHVVYWDGKDNSGRTIPSGIYFYKIEFDGLSEIKRMVKI